MSFSSTVTRSWNENRLMSALLELTYACNLDCVFCYNDLSLRGTKLSFEQYQALLEGLASMNVLHLSLSGGEPLAHPRFFDIGAHARKLGFVVRIKSNGHAIHPAIARRIRQEIDPFVVEVSMHGATATVHDRQTQVPGSFERLVRHIGGMKDEGLRVQVNGVLTRWNEHEVADLLDLGEALGVRMQIDPEVKPKDDGDRSPLALEATATGQARYAEVLRDRAKAARNENVISGAGAIQGTEPSAGTAKHCGAGSNTIAVDPYGNVLPCVQWRVPVGNLHERPITEIWSQSEGLRDIRATVVDVHERLQDLGDAARAARFCPGAAHTHDGDPLAIYPAAERRIRESARARVRLAVVS